MQMSTSTSRRGKYFLVRHKSELELVLEVQNGAKDPGTLVVLAEFQLPSSGGAETADRQLWYVDRLTQTIRNKLTDFCLQFGDDLQIIVSPYSAGNDRQRWCINGSSIRNNPPSGPSLGLTGQKVVSGERCVASTSELSQCWIVEYQVPFYLYIKPLSNAGNALDVRRADPKPGAKVIVYASNGDLADHQLWYEDENCILRSKLNAFAMDASGKEVRMQPYDRSSVNQQWMIQGAEMICDVNKPARLLHMRPGSLFCNTVLVAVETLPSQTGNLHRWTFDYIPTQLASLCHSGHGKYFVIGSSLGSNLALQVEGSLIESGAVVTMATRDRTVLRQQFYADDVTGTIRSSMRNYCLDVDESCGFVVINPYDPYREMQQWVVSGRKIVSRHDTGLVLQEAGPEPGSRVKTSQYTGADSQHWDINHLMAKCFYVISQWNGKVLDVRGDEASAGGELIVYERKATVAPNQLWYEDEQGILRSKLNGYVIDTSDGAATIEPFCASNPKQQWIIAGDRIQNKYDSKLVLDIYGKSPLSVTVGEYKFHGGENQRWKFDIFVK